MVAQGQLQEWTEHSHTDLWKSKTSREIKKSFEHLQKLYRFLKLGGFGSEIKPAVTPILVLNYK